MVQRFRAFMKSRTFTETLTGYVFMAPALIVFMVFLIIPIAFALFFSFTNWDGIRPLGQEQVQASGTVTFTNQTDEEIIIPAGSEVFGRDLMIFETTAEVVLPDTPEILTEVPVRMLPAPGRLNVNLDEIPTVDYRNGDQEILSLLTVDNLEEMEPQGEAGESAAILTNNAGVEVTLPEKTRIYRKPRVTYVTTEEVVLPAGEGSVVDAPIVATDNFPGREGHITRERITEITDPALAEKMTVVNEATISNGVYADYEITGTENYEALLLDDGIRRRDFFLALKNTSYFVMGVVPAQTILALVLAVILNQRFLKGRGFFRTAFYFPSITSSVVISIIFMWMFTRGGLVNTLLGLDLNWLDDPRGIIHNFLGELGITQENAGGWTDNELAGLTLWEWISGPSVTLFTIMILNTWTTIGTLMVIYLAALQNIPTHVYEAAAMDGANAWGVFRKITVPLLTPTTFFVVTLGLIGTFQVFDQVYVISSGGPAKTTLTIAYIVYENGFDNSQMGLAAATALILFVIIFTFTLIQRRFISESAN